MSTLTQEQIKRRDDAVAQAIAGYKAKNPNADQTTLAQFQEQLGIKIERSFTTSASALNSREQRKARLAAVRKEAEELGIFFKHDRDYGPHDFSFGSFGFRAEPLTRGGRTYACQYDTDERHKLFVHYAVAFCRPDENFDPLIGMEVSLAKFKENKILSVTAVHDEFGPVKLDIMAQAYRHDV